MAGEPSKDSCDTVAALLDEARKTQQQQQQQQRGQNDGFKTVGKGGKVYAMGEEIPERHKRAETPFKRTDGEQGGLMPKLRVDPTEKQKDWANRKGLCVGCGLRRLPLRVQPHLQPHLSKEQAKATLNAIRYGKGGNRNPTTSDRLHRHSAPLVPPPPVEPPAGLKWLREARSGTTPEAKKKSYGGAQQRQQQDPLLTLCVR